MAAVFIQSLTGTSAFILPSRGEQRNTKASIKTGQPTNGSITEYEDPHEKAVFFLPVADWYKYLFRCPAEEAASANHSII